MQIISHHDMQLCRDYFVEIVWAQWSNSAPRNWAPLRRCELEEFGVQWKDIMIPNNYHKSWICSLGGIGLTAWYGMVGGRHRKEHPPNPLHRTVKQPLFVVECTPTHTQNQHLPSCTITHNRHGIGALAVWYADSRIICQMIWPTPAGALGL